MVQALSSVMGAWISIPKMMCIYRMMVFKIENPLISIVEDPAFSLDLIFKEENLSRFQRKGIIQLGPQMSGRLQEKPFNVAKR